MTNLLLIILALMLPTAANPAPLAGSTVYIPYASYHHYPADAGMLKQPVWGVNGYQDAQTVTIFGSLPALCSKLRYGVDYVYPNANITLWSVRPPVECFDTLLPVALQLQIPAGYTARITVYGVPNAAISSSP